MFYVFIVFILLLFSKSRSVVSSTDEEKTSMPKSTKVEAQISEALQDHVRYNIFLWAFIGSIGLLNGRIQIAHRVEQDKLIG